MKKILLLVSMAFISFAAMAEKDVDAIYVWVSGSSTCYQLSSMPKVTYADNAAVLTLNGQSTPELTVPLKDGGKMIVTVGVYQPSAISELGEDTPVQQTGKYIRGGKLVIVKDGQMFDAFGNRL